MPCVHVAQDFYGSEVEQAMARHENSQPRYLVLFSSEFHLRDRPRLFSVVAGSNDTEKIDDILSRFTSPVIDDPRLRFLSRLSGVRVEPLFGGPPLVK